MIRAWFGVMWRSGKSPAIGCNIEAMATLSGAMSRLDSVADLPMPMLSVRRGRAVKAAVA